MSLREALRNDRGEGAIAVLVGTVLFALASAGVISFMVLSLGATALAQSNEMRTSTLQQEVQDWEKTAWSEIVETPVERVELTRDGRTYDAVRRVIYSPELNGYALTIATARAKPPGEALPDCVEALDAKVNGCISVSGYITATSDEVAPEAPAGVTITAQQVSGDGAATNRLSNPGFEQGLSGWDASGRGDSAVISQSPPRSTGANALSVPAGSSIASTPTDATPGDVFTFDVWVRNIDGSGEATLSAIAIAGAQSLSIPAVLDTTSSTVAGWQKLSGQFAVPATVSTVAMEVSVACVGASTECTWLVDDGYLAVTRSNVLANPDFEAQSDGWVPAAGAAVIESPNRVQGGVFAAQLTGATQIASQAVTATAGQWSADVWLRAPTSISTVDGTVQLIAIVDGLETVLSSASTAALGAEWTRLSGVASIVDGDVQLVVRTVGAAAGDVIVIDDVSLSKTSGPAGIPVGAGYLVLATLDPELVSGLTQVRVSFEFFGSEELPSDMRVGVYCGAGAEAFEVNGSNLGSITSAAGADLWLWARVAMPDLERLQDCGSPEIRVYSPSLTIDAADIGTISVLRVLTGLSIGGTQ